MKTHTYTLSLDGGEFKKQRSWLMHKAFDPLLSDAEKELVEGLLGLTDEIADQAHDNYGIDCLLTNDLGGEL
jgi:hypothetical protein